MSLHINFGSENDTMRVLTTGLTGGKAFPEGVLTINIETVIINITAQKMLHPRGHVF